MIGGARKNLLHNNQVPGATDWDKFGKTLGKPQYYGFEDIHYFNYTHSWQSRLC